MQIIGVISTICGVASALMIFVSVLVTCQMIWVRFVMNESTIWQTEVVVYLMISATMLGLPYVQLLKGHVNVDLVPLMLPPRLQKALSVFTLALTGAVVLAMTVYGFELFHVAYERNWKSDTVWGASLWIPYLAIPTGFGLYLVQLAADLFGVLKSEEEPFEHGEYEEDY